MSAYTPAPWNLHYDYGYLAVESESKSLLLNLKQGLGYKTDLANAQLIAAAPELLEALKGVVRVADRMTNEFDAAHAVIAKATGEQA
jgi:hypothetical protein